MLKDNAVALEVPCFKAFDPVHVIEALQNGFDGVMTVVCSEEDCKLEKGRETADRNLSVLKKTLEKNKVSNRFEFVTSSPRGIGDFNLKLSEFVKKISSLPSSVSARSEAGSVA
jgi:coenzyme F420-reducing hydrogenase delta subunit